MSVKTAILNDQLSGNPAPARAISVSSSKIFNLHSNGTRDATDFQVISTEEYDKHGKPKTNLYVQYTIIGKNRTWPDFMPVKDFKKLNPKVKVKGLD